GKPRQAGNQHAGSIEIMTERNNETEAPGYPCGRNRCIEWYWAGNCPCVCQTGLSCAGWRVGIIGNECKALRAFMKIGFWCRSAFGSVFLATRQPLDKWHTYVEISLLIDGAIALASVLMAARVQVQTLINVGLQ